MDRTMYRILWYLIMGRGSKLIKTVNRHQEENPGELTQREIDLACGLKDKKGKYILYPNHFFLLFAII